MNPLLRRGFTWNIKPYFLRKIKIKKNKVSSAAILFGALNAEFNLTPALLNKIMKENKATHGFDFYFFT